MTQASRTTRKTEGIYYTVSLDAEPPNPQVTITEKQGDYDKLKYKAGGQAFWKTSFRCTQDQIEALLGGIEWAVRQTRTYGYNCLLYYEPLEGEMQVIKKKPWIDLSWNKRRREIERKLAEGWLSQTNQRPPADTAPVPALDEGMA